MVIDLSGEGFASPLEELESFLRVMENREKAEAALTEFEESNPPGRFRKQIIDWSLFKRTHGVEVAIIDRLEEELVDKRDYKAYMKQENYDSDEASEDFKLKLKEGHDGEGDGASRKLWIAKNPKRLKDRTRFVNSSVEEGSKAMKSVKFKDAKTLKDFCHYSQATFSNNFLRYSGHAGNSGWTHIVALSLSPWCCSAGEWRTHRIAGAKVD